MTSLPSHKATRNGTRGSLIALLTLLLPMVCQAQIRMRLPFDDGQWWGPATYQGHSSGYGSGQDRCIDFWFATNQSDNQPQNCPFWSQGTSQGKTVRAAHSGTVVTRDSTGSGSYGKYVIIRSDENSSYRTLYAHMANVDACPAPGQSITEGAAIGVVGSTGSTGGAAHLHFELHRLNGTTWNTVSLPGVVLSDQAIDFANWTCFEDIGFRRYKAKTIKGRPSQQDQIPPTVHFSSRPVHRWYRSNERIEWNITDSGGSGVMGFGQSWTEDPPFQFNATSGHLELAWQGQGSWTAHIRAWDNAGNNALYQQGWFGYDVSGPTAARTSGASPETWYKGSPQIGWTCSDALSGVKRFRFRWGGGGWSNYYDGPLGVWNLPEGQNQLEVEVEDNAWNGDQHQGNTQISSLGNYWLDNGNPSVTSLTTNPQSPSNQTSISVSVTASDILSGVDHIDVLVDGSLVGTITGATGSYTWNPQSSGNHVIRAIAYDKANNSSSPMDIPFTVDQVKPTIDLSVSPSVPNGLNSWYVTKPTVTLTGSDPAPSSGVSGIFYSINGQSYVPYAAPIQIQELGVVVITAYSLDNAGNASDPVERRLLIDDTAPLGLTLLDEGERTPSMSVLNIAIDGTVDPDSPLLGYEYTVGDSQQPDRWRSLTFVPTNQTFLMIDNLKLPLGITVAVFVRGVNEAGLRGPWQSTDGIVIDLQPTDRILDCQLFSVTTMEDITSEFTLYGSLGEALIWNSEDHTASSGFWSMFLPKVCPNTSLSVTHGFNSIGGLPHLADSDDIKLSIGQSPFGSRSDPVVQFEVEAIAPTGPVGSLMCKFESLVTATPAGAVEQRLSLFNWATGAWEQISASTCTPNDSVNFAWSGPDGIRFLEPGTRRVRVRASYFVVGSTLTRSWGVQIDQLRIAFFP